MRRSCAPSRSRAAPFRAGAISIRRMRRPIWQPSAAAMICRKNSAGSLWRWALGRRRSKRRLNRDERNCRHESALRVQFFVRSMTLALLHDPPGVEADLRGAHVIVIGNQKGGAGKSTVAMHLIVALMRMGRRVGALDLDVRQRSLIRYIENRSRWMSTRSLNLALPQVFELEESGLRQLDAAEAKDE